VDAPLLIEAYEVEKAGRNLHYAGEIRNQSGDLLARGRGRFVVIEPRESRVKDNANVFSDKKTS
jgi:acyl-CoA thioesterase FadM